MRQRELTPLAEWLIAECRERNLSWREASIGAGVDKGTISAIVRGQQPGLEVCKSLAAFFGKPVEHSLRLAGHLNTPAGNLPPEVLVLLRDLEELPEPLQKAALKAWRAVLEMSKAMRLDESSESSLHPGSTASGH